jgi:hypothetical protein
VPEPSNRHAACKLIRRARVLFVCAASAEYVVALIKEAGRIPSVLWQHGQHHPSPEKDVGAVLKYQKNVRDFGKSSMLHWNMSAIRLNVSKKSHAKYCQ